VKALLKFAVTTVREAAALIVGETEVSRYKEDGEVVTVGDIRAENYILAAIKKNYPDHGVISEEGGGYSEDSRYVWILDPIDGTKYYAAGLPFYAISLALQLNGELVLGVVYSPMLDQMYSAASGSGATLNGKAIHCSKKTDLAQSYVCLEIPNRCSADAEVDWAVDKLRRLITRTLRVRIFGVASLGLCFSAMGAFDGFVNLGSPGCRGT